jgi:hypothetical protein
MSLDTGTRPDVTTRMPEPARRGRPAWAAPAAIAVTALAGVIMFALSLRHIPLAHMDAFGLISALPATCLAGLALIVAAFGLALGLRRPSPVLLGAILLAVVAGLHGLPSFVEAQPRFPTTWQIAGFTEYIGRTGHTQPGLDAYFSWPGFFALVALVKGLAGPGGLVAVMQWWPLAINVAYLAPVWLILRNLRASWRAQWLAALLFTTGLWVGQDYFSPQSFSYFLYLLFIAIVLTWFRAVPGARPQSGLGLATRLPAPVTGVLAQARWRLFGRLQPGEVAARPVSRSQRVVLLAVLLGVFTAITVSHQLTPVLVIAAVAGLALARRTTLRWLPVLLAVIVIAWLSFAATGYWSGHLSDIFGNIGHLGGNVSSGVGGRLAGASPGHELVLYLRVAFAMGLIGLAGLGVARRRRHGFDDRAALVLTCAPFVALGLQSYGGEILLRVYMFALPAAAVLTAYLFFPHTDLAPRRQAADPGHSDARAGRAVQPAPPARRSWPAVVAATVLTVGMTLGFVVARYGNEAYEQTPRGVLAATDYLYAHDQGGARVLWLSQAPPIDVTPEMPWAYRDIEKVRYETAKAPVNPAKVSGVVAALRAAGPHGYLITTGTQEAYLEQVASYRSGWGPAFRADLAAAPGVRTVFANSDAAIYTLNWPKAATSRPLPAAAGPDIATTIWTPIGLAVTVALLILLATREFIAVAAGRAVRYLRPLALTALPLLAVFLVIVALRFAVLS